MRKSFPGTDEGRVGKRRIAEMSHGCNGYQTTKGFGPGPRGPEQVGQRPALSKGTVGTEFTSMSRVWNKRKLEKHRSCICGRRERRESGVRGGRRHLGD